VERHGGAREARALLRSTRPLRKGSTRKTSKKRWRSWTNQATDNGWGLPAATGGDSSGLIQIFITSRQHSRQFGRWGNGRGESARTSRHPVAIRRWPSRR